MTTTKNYTLLRRVGYAEAASYLILLLIAMPMKYGMGMDWAVKYTGWAHGILFMGYVGMVTTEGLANKWPIKAYFYGFVAALLPFGPIAFDRKVLDRL